MKVYLVVCNTTINVGHDERDYHDVNFVGTTREKAEEIIQSWTYEPDFDDAVVVEDAMELELLDNDGIYVDKQALKNVYVYNKNVGILGGTMYSFKVREMEVIE